MTTATSPVVYDEELGFWLRREAGHEGVISNQVGGYARRLGVGIGSRVLDIGGHIGAATVRFVKAGADLVVAVEPDPANYELLKLNCPLGHTSIHAAAVADDREKVTLWLNSGHNTSMHSLYSRRGRVGVEVPVVNMNQLITKHEISHVKMDCEGSEYDLLAVPLPETVRHLLVEFHDGDPAWTERIPPTVEFLQKQGFVPDRKPHSTAWHWVAGWHR